MSRDPIVPQQLESVAEVVAKTSRTSKAWTGRETVAGDDGIWHRLATPQYRTASYETDCGLVITSREARTQIEGQPTCHECAAKAEVFGSA